MLGKLCFLGLLWLGSVSSDCVSCTTGGSRWCVSQGVCSAVIDKSCDTIITDSLNCPMQMVPGYEYNDTYTRTVVLPLLAGAYARPNPKKCLQNALPTTTFYENIVVECYATGPNSTCHAYTAYDLSRKLIIVAFEGTEGNLQLSEEVLAFFHTKKNFFGHGNVFEYFYNAFYYLWNGGLQVSLRKLLYLYPNFKLLAVGHSMGASISSVFASHVIATNLLTPDRVQLITFGQPRTGDRNFSVWHDNTFLYSYRVNHHRDPAPHIPPKGGPDEVFHHRFEVWYNNDMTVGRPYTVCLEADGPYCSNKQIDVEGLDHIVYFNVNMGNWADKDCVPFN
ncbi:unnamed protein product [Auanema sp. JU1783]|nr:unnamed protein product [Auanema sp. JU1783]